MDSHPQPNDKQPHKVSTDTEVQGLFDIQDGYSNSAVSNHVKVAKTNAVNGDSAFSDLYESNTRSYSSSMSSFVPPSPSISARGGSRSRKLSVDIPRLPDDDNYEVITSIAPSRTSAMSMPEKMINKSSYIESNPALSSSAASVQSGSSLQSMAMSISKSTPSNPQTTIAEVHSTSRVESLPESKPLGTLEENLSRTMENDRKEAGGIPSIPQDSASSSVDSLIEEPPSTPSQSNSFISSIKNLASKHVRNISDISLDTALGTPIRSISGTASGGKDIIKEEIDEALTSDLTGSPGEIREVVSSNGTTEMLSYRRSKRVKSVSSAPKTPIADSAETVGFENMSPSPYSPRTSEAANSMYVEEKYLDTQYRYASLKRNIEFHDLFKDLPDDDRLLDDFSCALSREILLQGRLYVSEHYVCFNSNLLGWVTTLVMSHDDIVHFERKNTAGLFPNGIIFETKDSKHSFASFVSRDSTLNFIETIWSKSVTLSKSKNETSRDLDVLSSNISPVPTNISNQLSENDIYTIDESNPFAEPLSNSNDSSSILFNEKTANLSPVSNTPPPYELLGPREHAPTSHDYDPEPNGEFILLDETYKAPLGLMYNIMFGEKIEFHKHIMELNDGEKFSEYSKFTEDDDNDDKLARSFEYEKKLNYSVGPRSTHVFTTEIINHLEFGRYFELTSTSKTPNVPSGNVFEVVTRYIMTWDEKNQTRLQLSYKINWCGSSWIKGMIEKSTKTGQIAVAESINDELLKVIPECMDKIDYSVESVETLPSSVVEDITMLNEKATETERRKSAVSSPKPVSVEVTNDYGALLEPLMDNWLTIVVILTFTMQLILLRKLSYTNNLLVGHIEEQSRVLELLEQKLAGAR